MSMKSIRRVANRIRILFLHPLTRWSPFLTILRWIQWTSVARRPDGVLVVPFVDNTRIRITARNPDARTYAYLALPEFEDMGFILHAVRSSDLFADVGAFVGGYTLLAAGACGAHVVAVEPNRENHADLTRNVELNGLSARVDVRPVALGAAAESIRMQSGGGSGSHVLLDEESIPAVDAKMDTLDAILGARHATFLKIDVEGYEADVLAGARQTLQASELLAVLIELNSSGLRYGQSNQSVHEQMLTLGFHSFRYEPWTRALISLNDQVNADAGNTLYIRDFATMQRRIQEAETHRVHHTRL